MLNERHSRMPIGMLVLLVDYIQLNMKSDSPCIILLLIRQLDFAR